MPLFITSLNSGSNGNCYYVGNERDAVLIDAGLSCRQTEKRMQRLGLPLAAVKAIFISHEHTDHVSGIAQLAGKYQWPVFITPQTLYRARVSATGLQIRSLRAYEPVWVGELCVTAFPKLHDACDPLSFVVSGQGTNVGVFTDIGQPCEHVIHHFRQCHAAFLEANYDEEMLEKGRYPEHLKRRIRGEKGHLSNQQALALFRTHKPAFMSHVVLAHVSKENNRPQLIRDLFTPHRDGTEVIVASREEETPVYRIEASQVAGQFFQPVSSALDC